LTFSVSNIILLIGVMFCLFAFQQGFSVSQIRSFTTSQANAVTAEMQRALSEQQLQALLDAGAMDLTETSDGRGGAGMYHVGVTILSKTNPLCWYLRTMLSICCGGLVFAGIIDLLGSNRF
jgi:hypothetical protein